ncbi:hypothetical protein J2776_006098 [Paraburkholderia caledonica]|uniref:Uncharacterized protein n=1 Tax=Paraburkholderia caledonica TaxID=134536 RepID=A0ABU1L824_9BURK|nr:hypothetical protein [Paraburkholderia caledonica]
MQLKRKVPRIANKSGTLRSQCIDAVRFAVPRATPAQLLLTNSYPITTTQTNPTRQAAAKQGASDVFHAPDACQARGQPTDL